MILQIVMILGLTAAVVIGFVVYTLKNLLLVSNPSEVLILSGGTHTVEGRAREVLVHPPEAIRRISAGLHGEANPAS